MDSASGTQILSERVAPFGFNGSKLACSSPSRFAGLHVLHRLLAPRHPPCTLRSLAALRQVSKIEPITQLAKLSYPHHVFLTPNDADDPCVTICAYAVVQVLPRSSSQRTLGGGHRMVPGCDSGAPRVCVVSEKTTLSKGALLLSHTFGDLSRVLGPISENLLKFVGTPPASHPRPCPWRQPQDLHLSYRRKREYIIPIRKMSRGVGADFQNCFRCGALLDEDGLPESAQNSLAPVPCLI